MSPRSIVLVLSKAAKDEPYWPRLVKGPKNPNFVKTDFGRWVDEDEEAEAEGPNYGGTYLV